MFNLFRKKKKYILPYFCVEIVSHCNLNCAYCDHFVPIAKEEFLEVNELERDFKRISEILNIGHICLMGGEPLLHPNLPEMIAMTRRCFPSTVISILTNGILLQNLSEEFWQSCGTNKAIIFISKYKLDINYPKIKELAKKYRVHCDYYHDTEEKYKTMYKLPLDITGSQDVEKMHKMCWRNKGKCTYFRKGKFFKCVTAGNIDKFNEYFNKNLEVSPNDYLDIYKITNVEQIRKYFAKSIPFCRYCNFEKEEAGLPFKISEKDISEWTVN